MTYFIGAGLLLVVAVVSQFEFQAPQRPTGSPQDILGLKQREHLNVVFILVDTLRADRLSAYGYERDTSPNLDSMARSGIRFANVLSQSSWTKTSMASLWTGTHPVNNGINRYNDVLPDAAVLPAERFREAGYRTAGIWRNGWVAPNFGFAQGFEFYLNPKPGAERERLQRNNPGGSTLKGTDEDLVRSTFEFLDNFGRERFFLYLHLMDLHQYVYDEAAARFGTSYSDVYDQSIDWVDRLIGIVVNRIAEIGQLENTVIVVASDHGEAFQEHGIEGHARSLFSEVVTVPWIVSLPFAIDGGIVVEEQVSNVDVWPTVLDLVGLPPLLEADGKSLVPMMLAAAASEPADESLTRPVYAQLDRRWGSPKAEEPMVSVLDDQLKIIWWAKRPGLVQVYDLAEDPEEKKNRFDPDDAESQRMLALAQEYFESGESPWGEEAGEVELDALRLNQLRALGYILR